MGTHLQIEFYSRLDEDSRDDSGLFGRQLKLVFKQNVPSRWTASPSTSITESSVIWTITRRRS